MLRRLTHSVSFALTALIAGATVGSTAVLSDGKVYLIENFSGTQLAFNVENWPSDARGVTLSIDPPATLKTESRDVTNLLLEFGNEVPQVNLLSVVEKLFDGIYYYEISVGTSARTELKETFQNGREKPSTYSVETFTVSGQFVVNDAKIVNFKQGVEDGSEKPVTGEPIDDRDEGKDTPPQKPTENRGDFNDADGKG